MAVLFRFEVAHAVLCSHRLHSFATSLRSPTIAGKRAGQPHERHQAEWTVVEAFDAFVVIA